MKQLLKILKNDEVSFRIKGSNSAYITNDALEGIKRIHWQ